jgi:hypothetical protein
MLVTDWLVRSQALKKKYSLQFKWTIIEEDRDRL